MLGYLSDGTNTASVANIDTLTGVQTLTNKTLTSPTINTATISGGTINNTIIGGTTKAAGSFTALLSTGQYTNTVADGTAPMVITSKTKVVNLNADKVGGLIIQCGQVSLARNATTNVVLGTAYSNTTYSVGLTLEDNPASSFVTVDTTTAKTASQFTIRRGAGGTNAARTIDWITVGN